MKKLEECCQRITENSNLIKETYGRLIEAKFFEKRAGNSDATFSLPKRQQSH